MTMTKELMEINKLLDVAISEADKEIKAIKRHKAILLDIKNAINHPDEEDDFLD